LEADLRVVNPSLADLGRLAITISVSWLKEAVSSVVFAGELVLK